MTQIRGMKQPIVTLYDGSKFSKRAFPWAVELARRTSAPLHIVRARGLSIPADKPLTKPRVERAAFIESERRELEKVAARLTEPGVSVQAVLLEDGPSTPQLIEYIQQQNAAWVVMATHGQGGFSRFWLGSTATSVIREVDAPIFLLPGKTRHKVTAITHIAAALDGSALSETILEPVAQLAHAFDARVTLVELISAYELEEAIYEKPPEEPPFDPQATADSFINATLATQVKRLAAEGLQVGSLVRPVAEQIAPALLAAASQLGAEILALSTHGRGFWSRAAVGSVADKILRTATIPLVIYRPRASKP